MTRRWLAAVLLGAISGSLHAQELQQESRPESLQDAWTRALAVDANLAAAQQETSAARASEKAARGARWPSVETGATYSRYSTAPSLDVATPGFAFRSAPIFSNNDAVIGYAQFSLPLYAGGSIGAGVRAAHSSALAADAVEQQTRADVKLEVAAAYFNVLRARRALAAAQSSVEALDAHSADVSAMVEKELVSSADMLAAQVALANAEQRRLRAANGLAMAIAQYNRRVGEPATRDPNLTGNLDSDTGREAGNLADLISAALGQRSELVAMNAQAAARKAQARAELGKALPQLALIAQYNRIENTILDRQDLNSIGVGFRWNIFDAGQARNRAAALRHDGQAMQLRADDLRSQIELQVREAWLALGEARARISATRTALAQAEENLRVSRELYRAGLASNTQVLDAVALAASASGNQDDAQLDAEFSRLRLARTVGTL